MNAAQGSVRQIAGSITVARGRQLSQLVAHALEVIGNQFVRRMQLDIGPYEVHYFEGDGSGSTQIMLVAPFIGYADARDERVLVMADTGPLANRTTASRFVVVKIGASGGPQVLGVFQSDEPLTARAALAAIITHLS